MELVRDFMRTYQQLIPKSPIMPDPVTQNLRYRLIDEEAQELAEATNTKEYLDAIGDLLYVVYGAALAAGFSPHQVDAAFCEIHRSNMSKVWTDDEIDSMKTYQQLVPQRPVLPDPVTQNLRYRLIDEEAQELAEATNTKEYLDAIGDLLYVVYGAALAAGFHPHQVDAAFNEIHRSNMSKCWWRSALCGVRGRAGRWLLAASSGRCVC